MARSGWYPDPGGKRGLFRYWDGNAWTTHTTVDPRQRPPVSKENRRWLAGQIKLLVGIVAVVLVLIFVIGALLLRPGASAIMEGARSTPPTRSAWDDSSPLPSATPTPTPTPSPTASSSPESPEPTRNRPVECDLPGQSEADEPPIDGRVHGGPLSFAEIDGWAGPYPSARFPYSRAAYVQSYRLPEDLPWEASAQVGVLEMADFAGSKRASASLLQCVITSDFYTSVDVAVAENTTKKITIGGSTAHQLDALLTFKHPRLKTTGSRVRIIVVESAPVTYYFHAVPKEDAELIKKVDAATASLTVD